MRISKVTRLSVTNKVTRHRAYKAAKNGSLSHARQLVSELLPDVSFVKNMKGFVCPVLKASGNRIPLAFAEHLALHSRLKIYPNIQLENEKHGTSMIERIFYQPQYAGRVIPGNYVIVDDIYTSGRTLIALKRHIENQGGNVIAAFTIGSSHGLSFEPDKYLLRTLLSRFVDLNKMINPELLANPQVLYLLRFESLSRIEEILQQHLIKTLNLH